MLYFYAIVPRMAFKNLKEAIKHFSDEQVCRDYLIQQRWNGNPECVYCGCTKVYKIENGKRFKCADRYCKRVFSVTVGTIYENSNLPLSTWLTAVWLATAHKKGISSCQLARDLGITQKTAWFVLHRIREMVVDKAPELLGDIVEVDETFVGGKMKNKHKSIRKKAHEQNLSHNFNKTTVVGILQRDSKVKATIYNASTHSLKDIIREYVKKDTIVITDSLTAYKGLNAEFAGHEVVNHNEDEFVRDKWHTNSIEGFFSHLKRTLYGTYHKASPKHLHRYCTEVLYRYNLRKMTDKNRFELSVKNSHGRLKYRDLIRRAEENTPPTN
ncbi:IS1595 family transposase [Flavisolibacter ginsenosidimutans]|uniref:IS1595 family transposase n=2 Tax=Flavisolibacter ginsenosidimutans TaxID=661481 RepID=A0A5B8UK07_9BACT|nr:IS1595 family transposase [Flavisolibacter ginsenosidimutans]